jgi:nucleolar pre-ribosomal-associated protein 1
MSVDQKNPTVVRIPSVLAAFLVRTCAILNNPLDPMYKAVSNFLLAKPLLSIFSVPEFLRLFHSKEPLQHDVEREWIVTVLRDGLRDDLSYSLMQQNFVFKMVQSFHDSSLAQEVRYFFLFLYY